MLASGREEEDEWSETMPELPEVETTCRGIEPHVRGQGIVEIIVRRGDLRQPVPDCIHHLEGLTISSVSRRSKYILLGIGGDYTLLVHLGMSGSLRAIMPGDAWKKHDHIGISLGNGKQLRFHDPRRFGLMLPISGDVMAHPLLKDLGPEPLEQEFTVEHLKAACAGRKMAIKLVIMDARTVVGVGNIYASEALYRAGIRPTTPAHKLTRPRLARLVESIRAVLADSIREGGTTLRDFLNPEGEPGYFKQRLFVYDRKGEPCRVCATPVRHAVLGQRSTYWCPVCQK